MIIIDFILYYIGKQQTAIHHLHPSSHLRLFRLLLCPPPWFFVLADKVSIPSKPFQTLEHLCFLPRHPDFF